MIEFLRNIYFKMSDLSDFDCDRVLKTTGFCVSPLSTDLTAAPCISYENCQKIPASTVSPPPVFDIDISTKILIGLGLVLTAVVIGLIGWLLFRKFRSCCLEVESGAGNVRLHIENGQNDITFEALPNVDSLIR